MKSIAERLRARGRIRLAEWNPRATPGAKDKDDAKKQMRPHLERIDEFQFRLHAEARQSLLIVLQGLDTAGKDGVIRHVMTVFNAQGCKVWSFKVPTPEEAAHDFLWRIHRVTPPAGEIAIFNRSHYEDVLVPRVHDLIPRTELKERYRTINAFEEQLRQRGTRVIKLFLHISREEQRERLLARIDHPLKRWKFDEHDLAERAHWPAYAKAYEILLTRCSTARAPWFIVPADHKWYRDLAVSEIVAGTLRDMDPEVPKRELALRRLRAEIGS